MTIDSVDHDYVLIEGEKELKDFVSDALKLKEICFDSETTGINPLDSELVALSFSWKKGTGYLVHFPESQDVTRQKLAILKPLLRILQSARSARI
jgi:DNA polymerase-1